MLDNVAESILESYLLNALTAEAGVQHAQDSVTQRRGRLLRQGAFKGRMRADYSSRCCVVAWKLSVGKGPRIESHDEALGLAASVLKRILHEDAQRLLEFGLVRPDGAIDLVTKVHAQHLLLKGCV